jgi:hypothetical protein
MSDRTGQPGESPVITVIHGRPAPAELAAALAVLLAAGAAVATTPPADGAPSSLWAERSRALTAFPRPGPGSWRASAVPHSSC